MPGVAPVEKLLPWVERLVGIAQERCSDAIAVLRSWKLDHLERELLATPDLDTIAAALLLVESIDDLCAQGVERSKLMKKLRDARDPSQIWPTWAEIRAAAMLIGRSDYGLRIDLEPDAVRGRHADFRLECADGESIDIEFKSVGLSNAEVAWHRAVAEHFNRLLPPIGLSTLHMEFDARLRVSTAKRLRVFAKSEELAARLREQFPAWADLRGISIVGHQTEERYLARCSSRVKRAVGQLDPTRESWLGLWWGNGAAPADILRILQLAEAPASIGGVVSVGQAVAVPWSEISCYVISLPRDLTAGNRIVDSTVDDHLASRVLERIESSSGIRATLLRAPGRESTILLRRDGRRRLFPFNLLFDSDPRRFASPYRPPSPVQDVQLIT